MKLVHFEHRIIKKRASHHEIMVSPKEQSAYHESQGALIHPNVTQSNSLLVIQIMNG